MHLTPGELARVEAMLDAGKVFSAPPSPCRTDRMREALLARAGRNVPPPSRADAAAARQAPRATAPAAPRALNWLDLPSLAELLASRQALLGED